MKRGDVRGLSNIVITLILIVLALVAIGVVWGVVRNLIKGSSEQIQTGSLIVDLDITNAYKQTGDIYVNVQRDVGKGEITKIKFILSDGGDSEVVTKELTNFEEFDSQIFVLAPVKLIPTTILTVSVAPVIETSDGERVGEITDTYNLVFGHNANFSENNNPSCTQDCTDLQCGLDPLCGRSCGTCDVSDTCTNGVCVTPNCVPELIEETCLGTVCGEKTNNCGAVILCNSCSTGTFCKDNSCQNVTVLLSGKVEETWPGTSAMYFGSSSLPTFTDYTGKYIKFSESAETRCLLVAVYRFQVSGYTKSHIGFNFETAIVTGDDYQIFETSEECNAA